jgi:uncharacterized protein (DUF1330 family)
MAAYMVVLGNNRSNEWLADYVAAVPAMIRAHGGEYLDVAKRIKQFEGPPMPANMAAIFTFPSLEKVAEFMNSPEYKPWADLRKKHMDGLIFAFDTQE